MIYVSYILDYILCKNYKMEGRGGGGRDEWIRDVILIIPNNWHSHQY